MDVLEKKGFNEIWISWMKQVVQTGQVCISIDGEEGEYFRTYKGLRHGDPLYPLMFDLVGDGLSEMFHAASTAGHVRGLAQHLIQGGVSHLQYADDTILLMECDEESFMTVKFLLYCYELYCYEEMSGLKISYQKSEVFGVGVSVEEQGRIANLFNYSVGQFPIKYLGLPVSGDKLRVNDLAFVA
jgi:hypothetical protein